MKHALLNQQHGFLPQRSTVTNVINFTQYIQEAFKETYQVHMVFNDLEKAFDRVHFAEIMRALDQFSVNRNIISLLSSFLNNRRLFVEVKGFKSHSYSYPYIRSPSGFKPWATPIFISH